MPEILICGSYGESFLAPNLSFLYTTVSTSFTANTLADPLLRREDVDAQIESQRGDTAALLGVPVDRVFALSARQALAARIAGDAALDRASRLQPLERALSDELMPRRRELLAGLGVRKGACGSFHIPSGRETIHLDPALAVLGRNAKDGVPILADAEIILGKLCRHRPCLSLAPPWGMARSITTTRFSSRTMQSAAKAARCSRRSCAMVP